MSNCPGLVTDLVLRCAGDDSAALGTLFDLLYGPVAATVGGPAHERGDLVVEVFQRVWRSASQFSRGDDPVAWVLDLARSTAGRSPVALAG